jgi:hypothetical protein
VPNGSIVTVKLADGNVTEAKLADDAVTSAKIADGAVVEARIADGAVTNAKLADMAQATIKGRAAGAGSGDPADLTSAQGKAILGIPTTTVDNTVPRFNGITGDLQTSGVVVDDNNDVSGVRNLTQTGYLDIADISAPSSPASNVARIHARDVNAVRINSPRTAAAGTGC